MIIAIASGYLVGGISSFLITQKVSNIDTNTGNLLLLVSFCLMTLSLFGFIYLANLFGFPQD